MGRQAERFLDVLPKPPAKEEGEILVTTADGKGVPLVKADVERVPAFDEKERPGNRRMATLGCAYTVNRKRFEPPLPDVPAGFVMLVVTPDMRVLQPVHPAAQLACSGGLNDQMEMVRHQAVAQHRHGHLDTRMRDRLEEGFVVAVFQEDFPTTIATVEDVAAFAIKGGSWYSWHGERLTNGRKRVKNKHACPLFFFSTIRRFLHLD